jgi:hypothetical protein
MFKSFQNAILVIALCALSTGVQAQNIYKCGDTYSQTPCPGASTVKTGDSRDQAQKKQTDAATQRDVKTGQLMEKERLAQEKTNLAASHPIGPVVKPPAGSASQPLTKIKPKRIRPKTNKSEDFVAQVPGTGKKAAAKKANEKKTLTPVQQ